MSIERLQACIRRRKTPVALVLNPVEERLDGKFLNNFTNMYGDCPMAHAEALRYHGSQAISQTAELLPAVILRAEPYLCQGFMGMDVLSNLVNMAKSQGMYTVVDARCAGIEPWLGGGVNADAVTARFGAGAMAETGYSLDIKDLRRRLKDTFLLLACCDGDNAYPAFDEYGHGAMIADESIQYAPDMAAAAQEAVATMKKTIQVL